MRQLVLAQPLATVARDCMRALVPEDDGETRPIPRDGQDARVDGTFPPGRQNAFTCLSSSITTKFHWKSGRFATAASR